MLEKPLLDDTKIIDCLREAYGLPISQVAFLPLGADQNTAVYRAVAEDGKSYFLKLRSGVFDAISVELPKFLSDKGVSTIIAPLSTRTGQLWADLAPFKTILYPFVEGRNGYEVALTDRQWVDFGKALKSLHTAQVPPALVQRIRRETYSPRWREIVKESMGQLDHGVMDEPVSVQLAAFLKPRRREVLDLVERARRCAQALQPRPSEFILCHSDLHAGNILVDGSGAFYIVDWDDPILAPKERDLMAIGGAQGFIGRTAQEEIRLFYRGYGQTQINPTALAYYRFERIVQDIAIFCEQILATTAGGDDRQQALHYLKSHFLPNGPIEMAYQAEKLQETIGLSPDA